MLRVKAFLPTIAILVSSILVSLPLLQNGLFSIHDDQQLARLLLLDQALRDGQFPVRWVNGLGFGFGYPLFNFYPPFIYYLAEIFHIINFSFVNSLKITIFLSILLSGLGMYLFVKNLFQDKWAAFVASIFYIYAPYRAVDIYIRGAFSESFAFVFIPYIFWSYLNISIKKNTFHVVIASLFLFLLMITHNLSFLITFLILPFYFIYLIYNSKQRKQLSIHISTSVIIAFCLSAFFWMPSLLEKKYTLVDSVFLATKYTDHFLSPSQIWNSAWGFGGSTLGLEDGISFKLGKLHIITSVLALIFGLFIHSKIRKNIPINYQLNTIFLVFILLIFSLFMTTVYSNFLWNIFTPLTYVQFPWRFLLLSTFFSSVLAGSLIFLIKIKPLQIIIGGIILLMLILINTKLFTPQYQRPYYNDTLMYQKNQIKWEISKLSFDYIPKGVSLIYDENGNQQINLKEEQLPENQAEIIYGEAIINPINITSNNKRFSVDAATKSKILINSFYFPGWELKVDNQPVKIDSDNKLKLISFNIEKGKHNVELSFRNTFIRTISNTITILTIILIIIYIIWKYRKISV